MCFFAFEACIKLLYCFAPCQCLCFRCMELLTLCREGPFCIPAVTSGFESSVRGCVIREVVFM